MTVQYYIFSVWESDWDMEFNPSKCQVVQVTGSRKPIKKQVSMIRKYHNYTLQTKLGHREEEP